MMDMVSSIAAKSMGMKEAKLQQDVHIAMLGKVMDAQEQAAAQMIAQISAINPAGGKVDTYA